MRYTLILLFTFCGCFGIQTLALRAAGGRTVKSDSNYFSSIGRIQAGTRGKPDVMVLGSSITGRLPDRAQGVAGVANMGCDGGSAVDTLRAMDQGILPIAPWIVIEANTLQVALEDKPSEIGMAMRKPWFRAGMAVPQLGAYARPAAFLYSPLLASRIGRATASGGEGDLGVTSHAAEISISPDGAITGRQEALIGETSAILRRLRAKGCRMMIVWLPPARKDAAAPPWIIELARRGGVPWWDLGQEAAPGTVTLTDGVHMAAPSASRTMVSLLREIGRHEKR